MKIETSEAHVTFRAVTFTGLAVRRAHSALVVASVEVLVRLAHVDAFARTEIVACLTQSAAIGLSEASKALIAARFAYRQVKILAIRTGSCRSRHGSALEDQSVWVDELIESAGGAVCSLYLTGLTVCRAGNAGIS